MELPQFEIGIEDGVSQDLEFLPEFGSLGIIRESLGEDMVDICSIASEHHVHVAEQGAFELKRATTCTQDFCDVVVNPVSVPKKAR